MVFDVLIIGGGAAGLSCALMLGSAKNESYAQNKKIGIIIHQRTSSLQNAKFNNVLGLDPNTSGAFILEHGKTQLSNLYPHVSQIENEKVIEVSKDKENFVVKTNKEIYAAEKVIIAIGPKNFSIKGIESYMDLHSNIDPKKQRTQLKNTNHVVAENLYVAGVLAGHRSQFAIACGSGTSVAMDILSEWNNGLPVKIHDKIILP